jgi:rubrerythrin
MTRAASAPWSPSPLSFDPVQTSFAGGAAAAPVTGFDLDRYLRNSRAIPVEDLPWDDVPTHPLRQAEVRFLHYMLNIEYHTTVYLKELLSTKAVEDGEVTAFLACWNYEELFHGEALARFLGAYIGPENVRHDAAYRLQQTSWTGRAAKRLVSPVVSAALPDFAAIHMTWGAAQELTTLHGYEQVARQTEHPVLRELMGRIVKDERRHFAFYYNQAEKRLAAEPRMAKWTRRAMDRLWRPVGVGAMPASESDFAAWYLFRDEQGQRDLQTVQDTMGRLPGMAGWTQLQRQVGDAVARLGAKAVADAMAHRPPAVRAA